MKGFTRAGTKATEQALQIRTQEARLLAYPDQVKAIRSKRTKKMNAEACKQFTTKQLQAVSNEEKEEKDQLAADKLQQDREVADKGADNMKRLMNQEEGIGDEKPVDEEKSVETPSEDGSSEEEF